MQRAHSPRATASTAQAPLIELVGYCAHAVAIGEAFEDPAHVRRFGFVDDHAAPTRRLNGSIPVTATAGGQATIELTGQTSMRLLAQIVEVQLVDQTAGDAHDFSAARPGVVAVGGADDPDAAVLQALHELLGLADVAAESV